MNVTETMAADLKHQLSAALVNRDADGVARAIGGLACGAGASLFARKSGLCREGLHRLVRDGGNLRMKTLFKALKELDIVIKAADV